MEPSDAKRMSSAQLFDIQNFEKTLTDPNRFDEYFFAYQCFQKLSEIKKEFSRDRDNKFGILNYGNGLLQGIYSVVAVCRLYYDGEKSSSDFDGIIKKVLNRWLDFENFAIQQPKNSDYFRIYKDPQTGTQREELNFINYYKGKTVAKDLKNFFSV